MHTTYIKKKARESSANQTNLTALLHGRRVERCTNRVDFYHDRVDQLLRRVGDFVTIDIQFLIACGIVCKNGGGQGRPGPFDHVNDIGLRGGKGFHIKRSLRPYLVVSAPSVGVSNGHGAKNVPLPVQNEGRVRKTVGRPGNETCSNRVDFSQRSSR